MKTNSNARRRALIAAVAAASLTAGAAFAAPAPGTEWTDWGGDAARTHFSPLTQINLQNVGQLKPVWVYETGDVGRGWQSVPLVINGGMYFVDPYGDVVAVDPETGKQAWKWEGGRQKRRTRGLAYWPGDGQMKPRLLHLEGGRLIAIDLDTGKTMTEWGENGSIDIGLPPPAGAAAGGQGGSSASPPVIYKNMAILSNAGGFSIGSRPGDPRAYDLRTGKLVWRTSLVPKAGEPGGDSWGPRTQEVSSGGSWGFLTVDEKTGTVYVPTDSAAPDYVGIWRPGDNKWANSTVALDAETGKIKWAFQTHHHDLFDWDNMAAPVPTEVVKDGQRIPVVIQTTKLGMMWIFDARTGQPLHGYEERPVAKSNIPGEVSSPTQPFTLKPPPLGIMSITRDTLSKVTPEANKFCTDQWDKEKMQNAGPFTTPFLEGVSVFLPGSSGAISWGGATINPDLGYAFTNVTNIPVISRIGTDGNPAQGNNGYRTVGNFTRFSDHKGWPCVSGPFGEMVAVNIATGDIAWRVPLGSTVDDYGEAGKNTGSPNIGPSIATKSGLVFIAATADGRIRAFDAKTGKVAWEHRLNGPAVGTPMTFMGKSGRQYVVLPVGGVGVARRNTGPALGTQKLMVAFAIPRPGEQTIDLAGKYPEKLSPDGSYWDVQ